MQVFNSYDMTWGTSGATSVDLGASSTSNPVAVGSNSRFSINTAWTTANAPVGTLAVQVCNAHRNSPTPTLQANDRQNWVTLTTLNLTLGTDPSPGMQHVQVAGFGWCRLVYTRSSGGAGDTLNAQLQPQVA